jgi:beta-lactamase regulating signal transducer with metallopeptidase domain
MTGSQLTAGAVLLDVLWQTTAWLVLGLALSVILERRPARAHGVVLLCLVAAALTPIVTVACRALGWGMLPALVTPLLGSGDAPPGLVAGRVPGAGSLLTWPSAVVIAWLALSGLAVARLVVSAVRGRRLLASARPIGDGPVIDFARSAARRLGVRRPVRVLASSVVSCPAIWCWGRSPRLLLPEHAAGTNLDLFGVLCHELAHSKRRDHLAGLAAEIVLCIVPWHPLAWIANRRLRNLSEQACDAWALAAGESPVGYAETLLSLVPQRRLSLTLAAVNGRAALARRITHILQRGPGDPRPGARWVVLCGLATVLLIGTTALAHRRLPAASPSAPAEVEPMPGRVQVRPDGAVYVAPQELDLGLVGPDQSKSKRVWLVNEGTTPRRITSAKAGCGCTKVLGFEPTTLGPGESLMLEIAMTAPSKVGARNFKYVTFHIDGQDPLKLPVYLVVGSPET